MSAVIVPIFESTSARDLFIEALRINGQLDQSNFLSPVLIPAGTTYGLYIKKTSTPPALDKDARIEELEAALLGVESRIYAKGIVLGSDAYFEVRKLIRAALAPRSADVKGE